MRRTWSFYDLRTGAFVGKRYSASTDSALDRNTPAGCGALEGAFDHLSQRVIVENRQVVDYQPSQPDADHAWDATDKRWRKRADVVAGERRSAKTSLRIEELRALQIARVVELLLPTDRRLQEIEEQIAELSRTNDETGTT